MPNSALRAQDVFVLIKLLSYKGHRPPIAKIASDLSLSGSQVHSSLKSLERSRLVAPAQDGGRPYLKAVQEFLIHGLKYAFPPRRGEVTRGIPTGYAAPPLNKYIEAGADPLPVWPTPNGTVRGTSVEPLHKMAPVAVAHDSTLYELLALVDALRDGRLRERDIAEKELTSRLKSLLHG